MKENFLRGTQQAGFHEDAPCIHNVLELFVEIDLIENVLFIYVFILFSSYFDVILWKFE